MADRILARKAGRVDDVPLNELIARIAAAPHMRSMRTLSVVREELETARRALLRCKHPKDSIRYRIIAGAVFDLADEVSQMERDASQIIITFDTDADVLMLEAA